jgi:predicted ABC-type ATPase
LSEPRSDPQVIIIAGPNGAGKSTVAEKLLNGPLRVRHYVNADVIALGLSQFNSDEMAIAAGKIMLTRLRELAASRESFAFETTLASRSFAPWIRSLVEDGYRFQLFYLWLPSPEVAIKRVGKRVLAGGHGIPHEVVRRRYYGGIANFFELYQPLARNWMVYNNSWASGPRTIVSGNFSHVKKVHRAKEWKVFTSLANRK